MIQISRNIKGISINGREWLLDENNNTLQFKNKEEACDFLKRNGCKAFSNDELETSFFFEETKANIPSIFLMRTKDVVQLNDKEFNKIYKEQEPAYYIANAVLMAQRFGKLEQIKELRGLFVKNEKFPQEEKYITDKSECIVRASEILEDISPRDKRIKEIVSIFQEGNKLDHNSIKTLEKDLQLLADECEGNTSKSTPDVNYYAYLWLQLEPLLMRERMFDAKGVYIEDEDTSNELEMASKEPLDGDATKRFVKGIISDIKTLYPELKPRKEPEPHIQQSNILTV